jgi:hypothetical protein
VGTSVESSGTTPAAFFDLDKTLIARSGRLAFRTVVSRHGLISRIPVCRGVFAQVSLRLAAASHDRMERVRDQVGVLCCD